MKRSSDPQSFTLLSAEGGAGSYAPLVGKTVDHCVDRRNQRDDLGAFGAGSGNLALGIAEIDLLHFSGPMAQRANARLTRSTLTINAVNMPADRTANSPS